MKKIFASVAAVTVVGIANAYGFSDVSEQMDDSRRVMEMIVDLGGHDSQMANNGKLQRCADRGTKKVSIKRKGTVTTYFAAYRNCREFGTIRDGDYTVITDGEYITESSSQRSPNGELFDAAGLGDVKKLRALIKARADVNYTESIRAGDEGFIDEWTPLMSAVMSGSFDSVKALVAAGAWVNYLNSRVVNALWIAANAGRLDMVRYLVERQAFMDNQNSEGVTPLMTAAMNGHVDVITYLLGRKAGIDLRSNSGDTALLYALQYGHTAAARKLVEAGADINARNGSGATALMIAAVEGNLEVVGMLLDRRADLTLKSSSGKSALDYAELRGHAAIAEKIRQALK